MNLYHVILVVFSVFSVTIGSFVNDVISARDAENCELVYMCPTFCLKSKGHCFVCDCGDSMLQFMKSAGEKMKNNYQNVYQTGSKYTNGMMGNTAHSTGSQMSPFNMQGMAGGSNWMGGGSGRQPSHWSEGSNPMTGNGQQWSGGLDSFGVINQGQYAPMMTSYLEPDFQEFYRPVSGVMPGRCPPLDHTCPSKCWKIDGFTGCMHCACEESTTSPTSSVPTSQTTAIPTSASSRQTESLSTTDESTTTTSADPTFTYNTQLQESTTARSTAVISTSAPSKGTESTSSTTSPPSPTSVLPPSETTSTPSSTGQTSTMSESSSSKQTSPSSISSSTGQTSVSPSKEQSSTTSASSSTGQTSTQSTTTKGTTTFTTLTTNSKLLKNPLASYDGNFANTFSSFNAEEFQDGGYKPDESTNYLDKLLEILAKAHSSSTSDTEKIVNDTNNKASTKTPKIHVENESTSSNVLKMTTSIPAIQTILTNVNDQSQSEDIRTTSQSLQIESRDHEYQRILKFLSQVASGSSNRKDEAETLLQDLLNTENTFSNIAYTGNETQPPESGNRSENSQSKVTTHVKESGSNTSRNSNIATFKESAVILPTSPPTKSPGNDVSTFVMNQSNNEVHQAVGKHEKQKGFNFPPLESTHCPEMQSTCESICIVYDVLRQCVFCACNDVTTTSLPTALETSTASTTPYTGSYCLPIQDDCKDECLVLDENHYFCPVCRCDHTKEFQKEDNSPKVTTNSPESSVDEDDGLMCTALMPGCPSQCVVFDDHWCATCSCPKTESVCPPLDPNCPTGCEGFDMDTFCPRCNCHP